MARLANSRSSSASCSISLRADRDRFGLHGIEQLLHLGALIRRQAELVGQLQHMQRSRIAVELGGERQAHAAPGPQIGDLLFGERLDGARLHSGIGLLGEAAAEARTRAALIQNFTANSYK